MHNFALVAPNRTPLARAAIDFRTAEAAGTLSEGTLRQLACASVQLETQSDQLDVALAQAVDNPADDHLARGNQLARRSGRPAAPARAVVRSDRLGSVGPRKLSSLGHAQRRRGRHSAGQGHASQPLHLWGHGLFLDEPAVELTASGRWQRAGGKIEVSLVEVHGDSWVARLNNAKLHQAATSIEADGDATLETDLATVGRWIYRSTRGRPSAKWRASWPAKPIWSTKETTNHATLAATIDNLQVALPAPPARRRRGIAVLARTAHSTLAARTRLRSGQRHAADQPRPVGRGRGRSTSGRQDRQPVADAQRRRRRASSWPIGHGWRRCGSPMPARRCRSRETTVALFAARPLDARRHARLGRIAADGRPSDGLLARGQRLRHADQSRSDQRHAQRRHADDRAGRCGGQRRQVSLVPSIRLAAQPAEIDLPRGPAVDHLELTSLQPAGRCGSSRPFLAEVTNTSGQFSVDAQGGQLPLANPTAGDVAGQLQVHSVEMQPGPILQTLLGFAQQIEGLAKGQIPFANSQQAVSLIRIENQTVEFRMVGGRVYHRGLQFTAGNVTITTRGSVGLDESLSVVAEIPMNAGLMGNNSKLKGIDSESLQIPIEGTLTHPKIDPRAIEKLTAALMKNTTRNLCSIRQQDWKSWSPASRTAMKLVLLGTAGYHPSDQRQTACLMLPEQGIVLDAGTGHVSGGDFLMTDRLDIFLTHSHLDHIVGLTYLFDVIRWADRSSRSRSTEPAKNWPRFASICSPS